MAFDIKICGLNSETGVEAALAAGATMLGFVFFPRSPRHVDIATACRLAAPARGRARIVALSVDADDVTLASIATGLRPDLMQLHGRETEARVRDVSARFGPVMKAVGIADAEDIVAARAFVPAAARVLIDAKPPRTPTALPGGNGLSFDWRLLENLDPRFDFMLSGGLDPSNVAAAIRLTRPAGVDVSSGVERAPGVKDPDRIHAFVAAARAAAALPG